MRFLTRTLAVIGSLFFFVAPVQGETLKEAFPDQIEFVAPADQQRYGQIELHRGTFPLADGVFDLILPEDYYVLGSKDAQFVMNRIWGNLPDETVLALIHKAGTSPLDDAWAVAVVWNRTGHVTDVDGASMDFESILTFFKQDDAVANEERKKLGFPALNTLGWSGTPGYDQQTRSLRYAFLLQQEGYEGTMLNAHADVLGRYGHVSLNVIGGAYQAEEIDAALPTLVSMVQFTTGNRYTDFIPGVDAMAEGGLTSLMGGGTAASIGIMAVLFAFLKKGGFLLIFPLAWLKSKLFPKPKADE